MPIPAVLAPVRRDATTDHYELACHEATAQALPGARTPIFGYGGVWPGVTLQVTRGRAAHVRVENRLRENVSVHNHGHHVAADSDGHPLAYVRPGQSRVYVYPNRQSGGTYWYHDHAMHQTGPHVYRGLAGFYLIHDPAEDELGLPSGEFDVPLCLQDRLFDAQNALLYKVDEGTTFTGLLGNAACVNGVHCPDFAVAARKYRLRLLNAANSRNLRLALSSGQPLVQIASDGALLPAPLSRKAIDLAPAERADCVVDFSALSPGASVVLRNLDPTWPEVPELLRFSVRRKATDASRVPARLSTVTRLDPARAHTTRRITFQLSDGKWTMNGLRYDPGRIDFRPRLGSTEIWELHNKEQTQMHPFHHHLVPFQVLDVNGEAPPPDLRGWKDTVAVPPAGRVRIIMRFEGFTGVYVFHCHKLEHEDHAMMLQEEVV